jgi:hypothetical protein
MNPNSPESITFMAHIAEVFDDGGRRHLKILTDPFYLTVDDQRDFHLGDKIELAARVTVQSIRQDSQLS